MPTTVRLLASEPSSCCTRSRSLLHFSRHRRQGFRQGIVDLLGIGDHNALAFAENDVSRHADDGGIFGNIAQHDRTGADAAVFPDGDVAENFRASADDDVVFDRGMPLAVLLAGASQSHALIKSHVIAHDRRLADHDAHAVIDEQPPSNLGSGMNFDSGEQARDLREPSSQQKEADGSTASDSCDRTRPHASPE